MKIEILVYDNQLGYYDLLREEIRKGFTFTLYPSYTDSSPVKYDAVMFFLHDEIELIDLAKLYDGILPFILGSTKVTGDGLTDKENLYPIDLNLTRDDLIRTLIEILNGIAEQISEKEKAL